MERFKRVGVRSLAIRGLMGDLVFGPQTTTNNWYSLGYYAYNTCNTIHVIQYNTCNTIQYM